MGTKALLGALGAGVLGAVVWALVSWKTGYEIGYLAWAVGGAVGFAAYALGSRGTTAGVICAAITLASIFAGKVFAVKLAASSEVHDAVVERQLSKENYDDYVQMAAESSRLKTDKDVEAFMLKHEYLEEGVTKVEPAEIKEFRLTELPYLSKMAETRPDYEAWKSDRQAHAEMRAKEASEAIGSLGIQDYADAVKEDLGPIDGLFALLGIGTAFSLASRRKQNGETPMSGTTPPTARPA